MVLGLGAGLTGAGILGQLASGLFGGKQKEGTYGQQSALSPEQAQMLQSLLGGMPMQQGMEAISQQISGYSPQNQLLQRQFREEFLPELSEQFGGLGAGQSSGFAQQASQGAERLASQMGAQQAQTQQAGLGNLMSLLQTGLGTRATYPTYTPGEPSMAQKLAPAFGSMAGAGTGLMGMSALGDILKKSSPGSADATGGVGAPGGLMSMFQNWLKGGK